MRYNGGFLSCYQSFRFVNQLTPLARKHGYIGVSCVFFLNSIHNFEISLSFIVSHVKE